MFKLQNITYNINNNSIFKNTQPNNNLYLKRLNNNHTNKSKIFTISIYFDNF